MPRFQWTDKVFDKTKLVYPDIDACFIAFEFSCGTVRLDVNHHWLRLVSDCTVPYENSG
jgi:hypothetical protein